MKLILFFKIVYNFYYLSENIQCKLQDDRLRNCKTFVILAPKARIVCYKNSFYPSVITAWNKLPDNVNK